MINGFTPDRAKMTSRLNTFCLALLGIFIVFSDSYGLQDHHRWLGLTLVLFAFERRIIGDLVNCLFAENELLKDQLTSKEEGSDE